MMPEPDIVINGNRLSEAQAMTIRAAIESFSWGLHNDGLGDDEHGKAMTKGYLFAIAQIRKMIYNT